MTDPAAVIDPAAVAERLEQIRRRVAGAGVDPARVQVLAVTKGHGVAALRAARRAGLGAVGESYAAELLAKHAAMDPDEAETVEWHFIGSIQRNKVAELARSVDTWQSVDRREEIDSIVRAGGCRGIFVQVLLAPGAGRGGVVLDQVADLVAAARQQLEVRGLMAVGVPGPPEASRAGFRAVARLAGDLGLPEVSVGMSHDLEVAVQEGSTMLRLGTALFGERPVGPRPRPEKLGR